MNKFKLHYLLFLSILLLNCKKENDGFSGSEDEQIEAYIKSKSIVITEKTATGLRYIRTMDSPSGVVVKKGQSINVNYSGKLLTDKKFDSGN